MCEVSFLKNNYKPVIVKPKSKKMSFEKKVIIQSIVSVLLLLYAIFICYTNFLPSQKQMLHKTVNISLTSDDIKNYITKGYDWSKNSINIMGVYFNRFCALFEPKANAETKANATTLYSLPEKPTPQPEISIQEEIKEEPKFRYPAVGKITSPYGTRVHPISQVETTHYGVDIEADYGDCVISSLPGTVTDAGFDENLGNYVKVKHSENMETVYGHMSEILVKKDEVVDSNTRIGSVGATGTATGPHVHLEVRIDGQCVDPQDYLPKE